MFTTAPTLTVEQYRWMKTLSVQRGLRSKDIPQEVARALLAGRLVAQQQGMATITPEGKAALSAYTGPVF
ncbi:hypothetical protein V8Z80_11845 [Orrella sp. JC864]|uniref:hypothetical protein n=1 Tax=Orrella sp. JC864 TaxID=3120298 RepID=UPI0012BD53E1